MSKLIKYQIFVLSKLLSYLLQILKMSFLFSMFSKGGKEQLSKYDRITFKINLSEHIPQYYQSTSNKAIIEKQLTPDHPLYYQIFPKKDEKGKEHHAYIQYLSKENDTFEGLSLRLDISEQLLRNINGMSGSLYPGMVIKLPKDTDISKLQQKQEIEQIERVRISQLLNPDKVNSNLNIKYNVSYFAGPAGFIRGVLTINNNYIIFNPLLEDQSNLSNFTIQKLLKFNVLVEMVDIQRAESMKMPIITQIGVQYVENQIKNYYIVQFMLYKVGNVKIQKKYKERLKQLKESNKPIASIIFKFDNQNEELSLNQSRELTDNINQILLTMKKNQQQEQNKKKLTNIPFFDIINDKTNQDKNVQKKQEVTHILSKSAILGTLSDQSDILTPAHFEKLISKFPILYKLYNWQRVYSARKDGSAFVTFLNKTKDVEPAILLIKQYKGNILGAFLVDSIEIGKTGRGQMFIFAFRGESTQPQIYEWTTKNQFFVYLDKQQGLGIGMGIKYGIFMNKTLEKGSSAATKTFGNPDKLSVNEDFFIDEVELWGVDNSF